MRCLRCDLAAPFGAKACVACSSVAFYHGEKPEQPVFRPDPVTGAPQRLVIPTDGSCARPSYSRRPKYGPGRSGAS